MIIYPTLEILGGKCVSLTRGRLDEPVIWHVDPVETARAHVRAGAEWMHLTDMDGLSGGNGNSALIEEIIRAVGIPVQLGGGFRSREVVTRWIDKGAGRIVVGTLAVQDPETVRALAKYHPDQIVVAVDVWRGQLMTHGWQNPSAIAAGDFIAAFEGVPLAGIIITDIDADIEESDGSLGLISGLAAKTRHPVIARGTVRGVDDVARLRYIPNIAGAMIGRALMARDIDLAEALAVARPAPEARAEFL
ncbi:1-(5-phosphoribosyl)-5-[(5-phosphoribosylamino)methylideneamino] imidazole-4-carboxamide isomerase [Roseovarius autotrophicus]|uniref:1-(5-phosphoribosyl)-5-[(5- phosphoribosylamino)methylideneamino] imidazole-4-carboxamide isomerase n=1 Tax=Roseovarius autotrophicus TaxID=2824121 RepID=UPI0019EFB17E|nr:1-(5-phosphoribosyl)-5-[(5-phosphoribosylamino)methylideneamino] imidazole-4-carboxamide isomerase [Roseovarius autotrophicus]MBE0452447.1 1-(5-phosphoribosyl)-5-[(5-phosphoribosylamino)methylideneamino] imidazole-4-carboxamide isomerase [Roseovarius sp.]